jgi:hypothetical protein
MTQHYIRKKQRSAAELLKRQMAANNFANNALNNNFNQQFAALVDTLRCPITREIMRDPVILVFSGRSYERAAIADYLNDFGADPETGNVIPDPEQQRLINNPALAELIRSVLESFQPTPFPVGNMGAGPVEDEA